MVRFTSKRERRLWAWTLVVLAGIYSTLGFSGRLVPSLEARGLLDATFFACFLALVAVILLTGLTKRPGPREAWVTLGVVTVYGMLLLRLGVPERTHLFEYGLVGVLIYQALTERIANGGRVRAPAVTAVLATALLGWLDEGVQSMLPDRVYDLVDVGFNALAAFVSVTSSAVLAGGRRWISRRRSPDDSTGSGDV